LTQRQLFIYVYGIEIKIKKPEPYAAKIKPHKLKSFQKFSVLQISRYLLPIPAKKLVKQIAREYGSYYLFRLDEHGLIDLPKIQDGDKIKLIKLVNASPVSGGYIAYQTHLPPEFELEPYIDREALYQSTFVSPVESFTSKIGWKHIDEFSVDDFFG